MSKRQSKTAAELMAELDRIPGFREREYKAELKRRQKEQEYDQQLEPILRKLKELGFIGVSLEEIVAKYAPLPPDAVEVLLSSLPEAGDDRIKEWIVRSLSAAGQPLDGRPLVECYKQTHNDVLKWVILNTIACTQTHAIDAWLDETRNTMVGETLRQLSVTSPDQRRS